MPVEQNPPRTLSRVTISLNNNLVELEALIDSYRLRSFLNASTLNWRFIFQVTHCTEPCEMIMETNHQETLNFHFHLSRLSLP